MISNSLVFDGFITNVFTEIVNGSTRTSVLGICLIRQPLFISYLFLVLNHLPNKKRCGLLRKLWVSI